MSALVSRAPIGIRVDTYAAGAPDEGIAERPPRVIDSDGPLFGAGMRRQRARQRIDFL